MLKKSRNLTKVNKDIVQRKIAAQNHRVPNFRKAKITGKMLETTSATKLKKTTTKATPKRLYKC